MLSYLISDSFTGCLVAIGLGLAIIYMFLQSSKSPKSSGSHNTIKFVDLPTPKGYPILGHLSHLGTLPHLTLTKWSKEFGSLYRIKMGFQDVLIVNGIKTIRTALMKNSVAFAGRPHLETLKIPTSNGISLAFSDYSPAWVYEKGIAKSAICLYTTGKDPSKRNKMEVIANQHANRLVQILLKLAKQDKNNHVVPEDHVLKTITNAVCELCFGKNFELDDPTFCEMLSLYKKFGEALGVSQSADFWPIMKYFPLVSRSFKNMRIFVKNSMDIIISILENHWKTYDDDNIRDLTDCIFHERKKARSYTDEQFMFLTKLDEDDLSMEDSDAHKKMKQSYRNFPTEGPEVEALKERIIYSITTIFQAGFDTLFTVVHWSLIYLSVYPDTQEKIYKELMEVIPADEQPSYSSHASKCHYTIAWMYELLRHVTPLPILLPHATIKEVELDNCILPPGLTVYFNAYQVHRDPELWNEPDEFYPERFLDKNTQEFRQNLAANVIAWGMGKRFCPGKDLSKHEIFIFLCSMVKNLKIKQSKPGIEPVLPWPVELGISLTPKPFKVKIEER